MGSYKFYFCLLLKMGGLPSLGYATKHAWGVEAKGKESTDP